MKRTALATIIASLSVVGVETQQPLTAEMLEMEYMTSQEIYAAIHDQGKTTAIVFTGGTESRGPHAVVGGHNLMARGIAVRTARELGNALVAAVLPVASRRTISAKFPGGLRLPLEVLQQVNESLAESLIESGFRVVVLMGDHGTGQDAIARAAERMDAKYAARGIRVIYAVDQYEKARDVFNEYAMSVMSEGFDYGTHAGLYDTSMLLYLEPSPGAYVRDNYRTVQPNPAPPPGQEPDPSVPLVDNDVSGDPRFATAELGEKMMEIKVQLAVDEINRKLREGPAER